MGPGEDSFKPKDSDIYRGSSKESEPKASKAKVLHNKSTHRLTFNIT